MAKVKDTIVISMGGSMIVPDDVNIDFLKDFKKLILKHVKQGKRFVLITGGGSTCRKYQKALDNTTDKDWMGIAVTRMNGELVRLIFKDQSYETIVTNPNDPINTDKPIIIAAGWKPGFSTDMDAVLLAKQLGAKTVINLSNIDKIYDKDPKLHKDAKLMPPKLSWKEFRKIVGDEWKPGANLPFDPVASKEAEQLGLRVIMAHGSKLANLDNIFSGKDFKGAVIE